MGSPLVSVLVPCRNAAPWLGQALRSALDQTWPKLEIIVVDDGSTDESVPVAERFASTRCRVVSQEHRGAAAARNHALELAQGEMIQYLDADDFLSPDKVARQMEMLDGNGSMSWSSIVHLLEDTEEPAKMERARYAAFNCIEPVHFLAAMWGGTGRAGMVGVHQWLTPRTLIEKAGPWNENLTVDDDGEFFARVILGSKRLVPAPEALCFYRKFRAGENMSAAIFCDRRHRQSAMKAAQLKASHLLSCTNDVAAKRAVSRLITREIVAAYPDDPSLVLSGQQFLEERGLPLSSEIEGPPWFRRVQPWIGWKATRRLQKQARALRHGTVRAS